MKGITPRKESLMKVQVLFPSAPQTDHDAAIVARIVALIHPHRIGDYLAASAIHLKLEELGGPATENLGYERETT